MNERGDELFVRELEVQLLDKNLYLHQQIEGELNCIVWDASIVLAKYLERLCGCNKDYVRNLKIIELGAGVGCVGLMAAALGADVTLTDLREMLPLLEYNILANLNVIEQSKGKAKAVALNWNKDVELGPFDKVLLADCVYYLESVDALISKLKTLSNESTEILQSQEMRDSEKQIEVWQYYCSELEKYFVTKEIPLTEQDETFSSCDIKILSIKRK